MNWFSVIVTPAISCEWHAPVIYEAEQPVLLESVDVEISMDETYRQIDFTEWAREEE